MEIDVLETRSNRQTPAAKTAGTRVAAREALANTACGSTPRPNEWQQGTILDRPQPRLLRLYDESAPGGRLTGSTCFFRNRALLLTLLEKLDPDAEEVSVLVHAASVGCDAYSFAIAHDLFFQGRRHPRLRCFATDLSGAFLEKAHVGVYPAEMLADLADEERRYFETVDETWCRVRADIRERIIFLPPSSYVDFAATRSFDVVFLLNSLMYVSPAEQARTFDNIAQFNTSHLVTSGFHVDQICADLRRNGYEPVRERLETIYNGWTCREEEGTLEDDAEGGFPAEPLHTCDDYAYRFGCLFSKGAATPAKGGAIVEVANKGAEGVTSGNSNGHASARRLRVALFNETGRESHVGCLGVSSAHNRMFARLGMDVALRSYLNEWRELWRGDALTSLKHFHRSDLAAQLRDVDAVVVNGEGTIHHGAGLHLLTVLAGAQSLGLRTFLVNAVFQDCRQDLPTLRRLDDFTVRDARSSEYLRSLDVPHRVVLDSIFEADFATEPAHDFRGKIVVTDWLQCRDEDVGAAMKKLLTELGDKAVFYPLHDAQREKDWRHAVADFRPARLVVTARHHGVCLAAAAGVPFVALGSNTWKVEGMLSLLPGNLRLCGGPGELRAMCNDAMREPEKFEAIRQYIETQRPLSTFQKLASVRPPPARPLRPEAAPSLTISTTNTATTNGSANKSDLTVNASPEPPGTAGSNPLGSLAADSDLWVEDHLTIAGEGTVFVVTPGATEIVGHFLRRGIDARGIDVRSGAAEKALGGRCRAGKLEDAFAGESFASAMLIGVLDQLADGEVAATLGRLAASLASAAHVRVLSNEEFPYRDRSWWEQAFFAAGFRKHPRRCQVLPFDRMDVRPWTFYFERLPASPGVSALPDPLRASGREADLALLPYEIAAPLVRPWDTVLDIACGAGAGTHLLRTTGRASRVIGCNHDPAAIDYAKACFGAPTVEFRPQAPAEALTDTPEGSVDFAILGPALTDPGAFDGLLEGAARLLAPGGRLIVTLGAENRSANQQKLRSCHNAFLTETVWRVGGDGAGNSLQRIQVNDLWVGESDTWIVVLMKDPLCIGDAAYHETAFRHVAGGPCAAVLNYPDFYQDPWILHSLVHAGIRLNSPELLAQTAQRLLLATPPASADAGAALCVLLYRAMDGALPDSIQSAEIESRAAAYLAIESPNAHQFRWQVSLTYALAQLSLQRGELANARKWFATVGQMDVFKWGPSLATKTSEALFMAGWLAWCGGEPGECRRFWTAGLDFARKLLARPLDETLLNPEFPSLFDYGDGMRELIYALENAAMCANGLHGLKLREQGIAFRWDLIRNSFRTQRDQRDRWLRQAQQRVGDLCREVDEVRRELKQRTEELDAERARHDLATTLDAVMDRL